MNINEVITCIMTNWIAANLVTWFFDKSNLKNMTEAGKVGYTYKTSVNGVQTPVLGLDKIFAGSQVNGGIIIAVIIAVIMYVMMSKTTFGYELKACGANRHAAKYAGINDKKNIIPVSYTHLDIDRNGYYFFISLFNQIYWVIGCVSGALLGNIIPFDTTGVDFVMTALFVVIFLEQWESCLLYTSECKNYGIKIAGAQAFNLRGAR